MVDPRRVGQAGLKGWRQKVAARVASPIAQRTPLSEADARALIGAIFFALSLIYVAKTSKTMLDEVRTR